MASVIRTTEEVVPEGGATVARPGSVIARTVYFITSIIEAILIIRLLLALLGANSNNAFASFIYAISWPFVQPFIGLFTISPNLGVARLEIETLMAIIVVALISWVIANFTSIGDRH